MSVSSSFISADYLASRCQAALDCMGRLHSATEAFLADDTGERSFVIASKRSKYVMCNKLVLSRLKHRAVNYHH